jgi:hypothetical protein
MYLSLWEGAQCHELGVCTVGIFTYFTSTVNHVKYMYCKLTDRVIASRGQNHLKVIDFTKL